MLARAGNALAVWDGAVAEVLSPSLPPELQLLCNYSLPVPFRKHSLAHYSHNHLENVFLRLYQSFVSISLPCEVTRAVLQCSPCL